MYSGYVPNFLEFGPETKIHKYVIMKSNILNFL